MRIANIRCSFKAPPSEGSHVKIIPEQPKMCIGKVITCEYRRLRTDSQNAILPSMRISYLECTRCGDHLPADRPQNVCPKDGGVLYVRYDLASLKGKLRREDLSGRVASMWRYAEVLPNCPRMKSPSRSARDSLPCSPAASTRMSTSRMKA